MLFSLKKLTVKKLELPSEENLSHEESETIKSLLNYPSLERIFDAEAAHNLFAIKLKMRSTIEELERVVRRGAKNDADKAARAVKGLQTTLDFIAELEKSRQTPSK